MFRLEEFPEEPPALGRPRDPPESPWGGTPTPSQPGTPTAEQRSRLGSDPAGGRGGAEGGGGPPGEAPGFRGRSRSAPPVLWAALRYGRELRRMSDEFQLQVLPRPRSLGGRGGPLGLAGGLVGPPPPPRPPAAPPPRRDPP
ncbi:bcl2-associated agonist of cell death-like [Dromaius novaehollandiae]|uniref:bcl2-associated agonist of cell death-like n=1 Tax=Dromaius novaehollandiae TaxID=8790 RepID=UPI00311D960F